MNLKLKNCGILHNFFISYPKDFTAQKKISWLLRKINMNKIHEDLYDILVMIGEGKETSRKRQGLSNYLAIEEYIKVNDKQEVHITNKGLELLKSLEDIKHNERSRTIIVWGIIISALFSLLALIISIISFNRGG